MSGGSSQRVQDEVRVRLVADPASVPAARTFVRDALTAWQLPEIAEDASLCVSELASNAALHSASAYFQIVLDAIPGAVRICVDDQGAVPAAAVVVPAPEREEDSIPSLEELASTGRGLMIVSAIAGDWGVEQTVTGKRVWAELSYEDVADNTVRAAAPPRPAVAAHSAAPTALPEGWHAVRLADCPVALSLRQDRHLDELIRELQLVDTAETAPSRELAAVIQGLLHGQAQARHMGRRTAQDAAAAGLATIDVEMAMPIVAAEQVQQLHRAVGEADALCEQQELLTLASPPDVVALREWMVHEIVRQIEYGDPPLRYAVWLERRR